MEKSKLVTNSIDMDYFSHIIIFPKEQSSLLDINNLLYQLKDRNELKNELKNEKIKMIIGFKESTHQISGSNQFNESDIALDTNAYDALQFIHAA